MSNENLNLDEAMQKLNEISKKIEDKNISIDQMINLYEEGAKLALICKEKIKDAESRMITLSELMKDDK